MRKQRRVLIGVLLALTATLAGGLLALPGLIEARQNTFIPAGLIPVSAAARALHGTLLVADLHDDLLLWNRDPLERSTRGHSDVPRLLEGRTAVQVFSAVTKTPRGMNYAANTGDSDNITLLALVQRWPIATWRSRTERALHQA
ncbi:MAG: peptidase M19, partial [Gemmatimonadaceae bacterium]